MQRAGTGGLKLNNPAGHLDPGESLPEGCARQALEETTHTFKPTALVGIYMFRMQRASTREDVTFLRFAFCGELGSVQAGATLDHGIERTLWMTPQENRDSQAGQRVPLSLLNINPSVSLQNI